MTRVFVTVGTTKFDELIENVISEENVKVKNLCIYRRLLCNIVQYMLAYLSLSLLDSEEVKIDTSF